MNVASKELCQELYELSGWKGTAFAYTNESKPVQQIIDEPENYPLTWSTDDGESTVFHPAYDLGYLIRKLRDEIRTNPDYGYAKRIACADKPEDEAALICIGLIKNGHMKGTRE